MQTTLVVLFVIGELVRTRTIRSLNVRHKGHCFIEIKLQNIKATLQNIKDH